MTTPSIAFAPLPPERGSLRWYLNRLRVMSPAEVGHRVQHGLRQLAVAQAESLGLAWHDDPWLASRRARQPGRPLRPVAVWIGMPQQLDMADRSRVFAAADELAAGRWTRLDGTPHALDLPGDWHHDHRAHGQDIRLWMELHRHAHLVVLAQAYALGRQPAHFRALKTHLSSWLAHCPRGGQRGRGGKGQGLAWASALDVALRLINWSVVWQLLVHTAGSARDDELEALRELLGAELLDAWLASIPLHVHAIRGNLSRHSSANNHLMGELVGILVADATWPYWVQHQRWADEAWRSVCQSCLAQVAADGVNHEQASWYLAFVFELMVVSLCIGRAQGRLLSHVVGERVISMVRFAQALRSSAGRVLHHGDADDAHATGLMDASADAIDRMLRLAHALPISHHLSLPGDDIAVANGRSGIGAWFAPPAGLAVADAQTPQAESTRHVPALRPPLPRRFDSGGYYLLGARFGEPDEIKLLADAGALGYLSIAAHGHADALSLRLAVAGRPILVDRGSGYYNVEPAWRQYLRGTLAHNTVSLDGQDQSVYGGPFLWLRKAQCRLSEFVSDDSAGAFRASHDGYARLAGQPLHSREVLWSGSERRFLVRDALSSRSEHQAIVAWHFDPACAVSLHGDVAVVRNGPVTVTLQAQGLLQGRWSLHLGDADGPLGWHSPGFGRRVPAPTLLWHVSVPGNLVVATTLDIHIESNPCDSKS